MKCSVAVLGDGCLAKQLPAAGTPPLHKLNQLVAFGLENHFGQDEMRWGVDRLHDEIGGG